MLFFSQPKSQKHIRFICMVLICFFFNFTKPFSQPIISSFSPSIGSIGTLVTINGTNLGNPNALSIGGTPAILVSSSNNKVVIMAMPGTSTGNISLSTSAGSTTSNSNFIVVATYPPNTQQGSKLVGTNGTNTAAQGFSVSISADGNTAIVGSHRDNTNVGAAWIYVRSGNTWTQQGNKLVGTGAVGNAQQGHSVGISADGNTAIVGGYFDNTSQGAAWIFTRTGTTWTQQGSKLKGTGNVGPAFQGYSVCLSTDGNTAMIGGSYDNGGHGAIWVFNRSGNTWSQHGNKLTGSDSTSISRFGSSISLSANGNNVIVGGYVDWEGSVWFFKKNGNVWTQQDGKKRGTNLIGYTNFGVSVAISADGNTAVAGSHFHMGSVGAIWVFTRSGDSWSHQGSKLVGSGGAGVYSMQGRSVAISADGNTIFVGGYADSSTLGAIWTFARSSGIWVQQGLKLLPTGNANNGVHLGFSLALSSDGKTLIAGGPFENNNSGAAWIFTIGQNSNAYLSNLTISQGTLTPAFGYPLENYDFDVSNSTTSISFTPTAADPLATIQISANGGTFSQIANGTASNTYGLSIGKNSFLIKVIAQDGITTKNHRINIIRASLPPIITSVSPSSGNIGNLINISGSYLTIPTSVTIGGVPALVTNSTDNSITIMIMPGTTGGNISVTTSAGTVLSSTSISVTNSTAPISQLGDKIFSLSGNTVGAAQGHSVAISADGNTMAIGANKANNSIGGVFVYRRVGNSWFQQGSMISAIDVIGNSGQGSAVGLSADGNTLAIGGTGDNGGRGAVWIFSRVGTTWIQQNKLLSPETSISTSFGCSLSLSANGNTLIIGEVGNIKRASWIFNRNGSEWAYEARLVGAFGSTFNRQGNSVGISADGKTAIVGAPHDDPNGAAWIFVKDGNNWVQQSNKLVGLGSGSRQGISVALSADGNTAIIGNTNDSNNYGCSHIFTRTNGLWAEQAKLVGTGGISQPSQGFAVSMDAEGNTVIVGGYNDNIYTGASWVFKRNGNIWTQQGNKIVGTNPLNSHQGCAVAMSADGKTAVVGGYNDGTGGASWVFGSAITTPVTFDKIKASMKNTDIKLKWTVSSEINVDYYEVEKSSNGSLFSKNVTVKAVNKSMYEWLNINPFENNNFYRIKYIDKDGSFGYSQIVTVKASLRENSFITTINPVKNKIVQLQLSNAKAGIYQITILNSAGQRVAIRKIVHTGGSTSESIFLGSNVNSGYYQLKIEGNNSIITKSIIVY